MIKFKNIKWLLCLMVLPFLASCGWEDLPAYEENDITAVAFYYRYASPTDKDPITGEPMVRNVQLSVVSPQIDNNAGTVTLGVSATNQQNNLPAEVYSGISQSNLVGTVTLSTAARIAPSDNHKVLGVPDDWTQPHNFVVTAADGSKKNWTITVTSFSK